MNACRTSSARPANARSQPRTVDGGRPSSTGDRPVPGPGRLRLQRRPDHRGLIGPPRQARHRQQHMRPPAGPAPGPPRRLTAPACYPARGPGAPAPGPTRPARRRSPGRPARPTRAAARLAPRSALTVSTGASVRHISGPPVSGCQIEGREGRRLPRRDHRAVAHEKGQPHRLPSTSSSPSATSASHYMLITSDGRHRPGAGLPCRPACRRLGLRVRPQAPRRRHQPRGQRRAPPRPDRPGHRAVALRPGRENLRRRAAGTRQARRHHRLRTRTAPTASPSRWSAIRHPTTRPAGRSRRSKSGRFTTPAGDARLERRRAGQDAETAMAGAHARHAVSSLAPGPSPLRQPERRS